jgi:general secretion pathway protein G
MLARSQHGFTLAETLLLTALLALGADAILARTAAQLERSRLEQARRETGQIQAAIRAYRDLHHELPAALTDLDPPVPLDPWGRPYEYMNFDVSGFVGQRTFDGRPVNSEFDLYSKGPDGQSDANLRSEVGSDDIIVARDGAYIGPSADF